MSELNRYMQTLYIEKKVLCVLCYKNHASVTGYLKFDGLKQHILVKHPQIKFDEELKEKCMKLFRGLHGNETLKTLKLFCDKNYVEFSSYELIHEKLSASFKARTVEEAVKLFGLALYHYGYVTEITSTPAKITVHDTIGKKQFNVWKKDASIYIENTLSHCEINWDVYDQPKPCEEINLTVPIVPADLKEALKLVFNYDEFKPGQREAIIEILARKDCTVIIPTGGGKTLIYTLPGMMLPGLTVVVQPLIMLMYDQVRRLRELGINTVFYNTLLSEIDKKHILNNLRQPQCQYKFIFLSPESMFSKGMETCLIELNEKEKINYIVIDEAHCVVTWGNDFRPDYAKLSILKKKFENTPIVALTGSATPATISTINTLLNMSKPAIIKLPCYRDNLAFQVIEKSEKKQSSQIIEYIKNLSGCGIVYCGTQKKSETIAFDLKENDIAATFYHAGMEESEKLRNSNAWFENKFQIICCTSAFGMGIDKKDVRFVIHLSIPSSLEDYIQQAGRAGRDGIHADCILFYSFNDRSFHMQHLAHIENTELRRDKIDSLNIMTKYSIENNCRQKFLCQHSGTNIEKCQICDICCKTSSIIPKVDMTDIAIKVIKCLKSMILVNNYVKLSQLTMTLMGSKAKEILDKKFNYCIFYGQGKNIFKSNNKASKFIEFLIMEDIIRENYKHTKENQLIVYLSADSVTAVNILNGMEKVFN